MSKNDDATQAYARRQRLNSANALEARAKRNEISPAEFREQMLAIGRPAMEVNDRPADPAAETRDDAAAPAVSPGGENDPNQRAKLGLPELAPGDAGIIRRTSPALTGAATPKASELDKAPGAARLRPEDSFVEYMKRHDQTGAYSRQAPTEFDFNAFFGAQAGFTKRSNAETRTVYGLQEGVSSGSGAAADVVGELWGHQVIDLIRAKTFLFDVGATTVPLPTQIWHLPSWEDDVQPSYVSEVQSLAFDTTPQIGLYTFDSTGAFVDLTGASLNALEDAFNQGGLSALLQNSIAQKYARLVETVTLYGQVGSTGNAGLITESGLLTQSMGTNGAAPADYSDISKAYAKVTAQNVTPNAIVMHPSVLSQYSQLVDTLGQPMRKTPDIESTPFVQSGLLNGYVETQGSSHAASSVFVGDWSYVHVGFRLSPPVQTVPLRERFIDQQVMAWVSRLRMSSRLLRASQTMCQLQGVTAS